MGLGAAFVMPATLSILNAVFPPKERPQAIAAWSAVTGIGIVIGPTLGGLLVDHFWWGSVFIQHPAGRLALPLILTVPETAEPAVHRLDIPGTRSSAARCSPSSTPSSRHRPGLDRDRHARGYRRPG